MYDFSIKIWCCFKKQKHVYILSSRVFKSSLRSLYKYSTYDYNTFSYILVSSISYLGKSKVKLWFYKYNWKLFIHFKNL